MEVFFCLWVAALRWGWSMIPWFMSEVKSFGSATLRALAADTSREPRMVCYRTEGVGPFRTLFGEELLRKLSEKRPLQGSTRRSPKLKTLPSADRLPERSMEMMLIGPTG